AWVKNRRSSIIVLDSSSTYHYSSSEAKKRGPSKVKRRATAGQWHASELPRIPPLVEAQDELHAPITSRLRRGHVTSRSWPNAPDVSGRVPCQSLSPWYGALSRCRSVPSRYRQRSSLPGGSSPAADWSGKV